MHLYYLDANTGKNCFTQRRVRIVKKDHYEDTQDYVCSISPTEFEVFCLERLKEYAEMKGWQDFSIKHNVKMKAHDGTYQIDVYATFRFMEADFKVLCECKQFRNTVKRDIVSQLDGKIRSLGAHKGIICSTSGFQKGAIEYAKEHGIALLQVYDKSCIAVSHSGGPDVEKTDDDPVLFIEDRWPKYCVKCFEPYEDEPITIYPTRAMINEIYREYNCLIKKVYGIEIPNLDRK